MGPAASDLKRARAMIEEFPDPGRLPAIAATVEQDLTTARANVGNGRVVEDPSAAELAVLRCLAAGLSRREIGARLYISLNTVKTHTRELYRKLGATSARRRSPAQKRSVCSSEPNHPGDLGPRPPKARQPSGMLGPRMSAHRYRVVVEGELGPRYASAFDGMTLSAHDGRTDITGPIIDPSHLHGLLDRIAGLGLTVHSLTPLETEDASADAPRTHTTSRGRLPRPWRKFEGTDMTFLWILLGIIYIACWIYFGLATFRKGHY